ncbi:MAG: glycine cleavage system protein H [Deltaproteobacteria bacterium GWA2_38_16]|nr:MAG: glycine cleavage system protein H [Deltaproteobacteria bacterium GWA2_38_16]OGQ03561.1 MAG: glycine cleavage system protein H [Deltaproteobacteria bacterium RIFCSPHIGHO2_02_FULL_38_15]OGQ33257.1 MAG: glycine cleavage system protein H [Deltaproteobacteria bacterium RIFCSPLOWO2_01_FULL_38_9]OGQ61424.1 MAG: glycine cleavage system protein H [Deltaproteobacteria bacterium RIFCSPLOWO2_12_FULL_38_8]HBQ21197.1 glycine cleavage system protein GcvH [Deltaproteobacteria bacterium]
MNFPETLLYTKDHEWALNKNGTVTVGITAFAQDQLGDIVYLELPKVGTTLEKGKTFGVVESVKAVSDLYSPVSGEVVKMNDPLKNSPDIINKDPYDKGWMIEVKVSNPQELKDLLTQEQYQKLVAS